MTVTIVENQRFRHLGADRSQTIKPGGVGVEKEVVCDITITTEDLSDSVIAQFIADFTQVGLKEVYDCQVSQQSDLTDLYFFIEPATKDAALCRFHVKQIADGTDQNSASYTATLTVVARGV